MSLLDMFKKKTADTRQEWLAQYAEILARQDDRQADRLAELAFALGFDTAHVERHLAVVKEYKACQEAAARKEEGIREQRKWMDEGVRLTTENYNANAIYRKVCYEANVKADTGAQVVRQAVAGENRLAYLLDAFPCAFGKEGQDAPDKTIVRNGMTIPPGEIQDQLKATEAESFKHRPIAL